MDRDALSAIYEHTLCVVSALLYSFDPGGMGATVGTPIDEYDGSAARLIAAAGSAPDLAALVSSSFPNATDHLTTAVVAALEIFLTSTQPRRLIQGS